MSCGQVYLAEVKDSFRVDFVDEVEVGSINVFSLDTGLSSDAFNPEQDNQTLEASQHCITSNTKKNRSDTNLLLGQARQCAQERGWQERLNRTTRTREAI